MRNLAEILHLTRPLVVLDVETTGFDADYDRIVQFAAEIHYGQEPPREVSCLVNPGVPIPPEATEVHGITDADVAVAPTIAQLAPLLFGTVLDGVDLAGKSVWFDIEMLEREAARLGWPWDSDDAAIVDVQRLHQISNPATLSDLYRLATDKELDGAHKADRDVPATAAVLEWQLREMYLHEGESRINVPSLGAMCAEKRPWCVDRRGKLIWRFREAHVAFGKYKGRSLQSVIGDRRYWEWVLGGNFPRDLKALVRRALAGEIIRREP